MLVNLLNYYRKWSFAYTSAWLVYVFLQACLVVLNQCVRNEVVVHVKMDGQGWDESSHETKGVPALICKAATLNAW